MQIPKERLAIIGLLILFAACVNQQASAPKSKPAAVPSATEPSSAPQTPLPPTDAPAPALRPGPDTAARDATGSATAPPVGRVPPAGEPSTPSTAIVSRVKRSVAKPDAKNARPATAATAQTQTSPTPLDLTSLEQRLRDTHAIGVFTKLSLKNEVDDLLAHFKSFHQGQIPPTLTQLRQTFELLLIKVVSVLQDGDAPLASAVSGSREALWSVLSDPQKFSHLSLP
jgi:hypothetical protein